MQINSNNPNIKVNEQKVLTNSKSNETIKENPVNISDKEVPNSELLKAYVGVSDAKNNNNNNIAKEKNENQSEEPEKELSAYEYLLTLPNVKMAFKTELAEVAKVMEKMDVESSNVEMMVNLVAEGKLWRGVLRYFCEHGKMSKPMENDIDLIYESYGDGVNPADRYVPTVQDKQSGINSVKVGDTFEIEGEKNIYLKDSDSEAHQLKVSKETFAELFPPAERFSCVQGAAGDCYLLSTLNSIIEAPSQRHVLYDMFEETEDSVKVSMPNGEVVYSAPKDNLRDGIDKWQHMQGATGMILAEHVYGEELKFQYEKAFHDTMNAEIEKLQKEEPDNISKIDGYKQRLADFDTKNADGESLPVIMRFENPDANGKLTFQYDEFGIVFKDLKSADKDCHRKLLTQADFYRGSIGGDLDVVMKDFGYKDIEEFKTNDAKQEKNIKEILFSPDANDKYIFTAGALSDGTLKENPLAKEYSVYGCHAYKIAPFTDKNNNVKFFVENPWNATQNSVMEYEDLIKYFEVICAVKAQ